jgi:16S rRNA (guanine(527)-N(7))-methyltransferase RsmG
MACAERETQAEPEPPPHPRLEPSLGRAVTALIEGSRAVLGRVLGELEQDMFSKYLVLLEKWQRSQRIVGSADPIWVVNHLILDSLLFLKVIPPGTSVVADLGSGAGIPGIPVKIVRPDVRLTLIESRRRRASFLSAVVRELRLRETRVVCSRAERITDSSRGTFDAVLCRCAGNIGELLPVAASLTRPGGVVVFSDSPDRTHEGPGERLVVDGVTPGSTRGFVVLRS